MKTSTSQFDLMVTFMEQHGDLSKPTSNARGRITSMQKWDELAMLLNSDGSGDTKNSEKWKKVWSDYKNNTKKKAARLHRAATGTGGGPAIFSKLSDIEQRVLNLIGVQVATGLAVEEAGMQQVALHSDVTSVVQMAHSVECILDTQLPSIELATPSQVGATITEDIVENSEPWNEPGPSTQRHVVTPPPDRVMPVASPPLLFVEERELSPLRPIPALSGQTTPLRNRARPIRPRGSPRRLTRPAHTEQAAQHFLQAEERWRRFKLQQHNDNVEIKREQNRIRQMELEIQRQWQSRALDMLEKLINKYCKD